MRKFFKPTEAAPYDRKYNFAWIVGPPDSVSHEVQAQVHRLLQEEGGGPS